MKTAVFIALVTTFAAGAASAQPSLGGEVQLQPETTARPPSLALPDLPEVSGRQERWVALLARVAERLLDCEGSNGDREGEYFENERCYEWFEQLGSAGRAGVHAMGRTLLDHAADDDVTYEELRMITMLGGSEDVSAVPYLVRLVASTPAESTRAAAIAAGVNESLESITGVSAIRPEAGETVAYLGDLVNVESATSAWTSWYASHGGERRTEWVSRSLEEARALLESGDDTQRFWAIRELVDNGARRDALPALRSLLSDPAVSAETRHEASRFARRQGLLNRTEVRGLVRDAQGEAI
jgi:hypothetical protein